MWLVVGLGNPGDAYKVTRHNAGFLFVDAVREAFKFPDYKSVFRSAFSSHQIQSIKTSLLKPQTYMNLSGEAVLAAVQFYKISMNRILVCHDDIDLPFGSVKVKKGGGTGGHNGLKSIEKHLGADFWRLRLGVGRPHQTQDATAHVLANFSKDEQSKFAELLIDMTAFFPLLLEEKGNLFAQKISEQKS